MHHLRDILEMYFQCVGWENNYYLAAISSN